MAILSADNTTAGSITACTSSGRIISRRVVSAAKQILNPSSSIDDLSELQETRFFCNTRYAALEHSPEAISLNEGSCYQLREHLGWGSRRLWLPYMCTYLEYVAFNLRLLSRQELLVLSLVQGPARHLCRNATFA